MAKKVFPLNKDRLQEIIAQYPTPFHIYDEQAIRENIRALQKAFAWAPSFREQFAVKALPNPRIVQILHEEGAGTDCSSLAELLLSDGIMAELPIELMRKLAMLPTMSHFEDVIYTDAKPVEEAPAETGESQPTADTAAAPAEEHADAAPTAPAEEPEVTLAADKEESPAEPMDVEDVVAEAIADATQAAVAEDAVDAGEDVAPTEPEPVEAEPVEDEPEVEIPLEPEPEPQPKTKAAAPEQQTAIETRTPSRLTVAFRLIGMGVKELFTGYITRENNRRKKRG